MQCGWGEKEEEAAARKGGKEERKKGRKREKMNRICCINRKQGLDLYGSPH